MRLYVFSEFDQNLFNFVISHHWSLVIHFFLHKLDKGEPFLSKLDLCSRARCGVLGRIGRYCAWLLCRFEDVEDVWIFGLMIRFLLIGGGGYLAYYEMRKVLAAVWAFVETASSLMVYVGLSTLRLKHWGWWTTGWMLAWLRGGTSQLWLLSVLVGIDLVEVVPRIRRGSTNKFSWLERFATERFWWDI